MWFGESALKSRKVPVQVLCAMRGRKGKRSAVTVEFWGEVSAGVEKNLDMLLFPGLIFFLGKQLEGDFLRCGKTGLVQPPGLLSVQVTEQCWRCLFVGVRHAADVGDSLTVNNFSVSGMVSGKGKGAISMFAETLLMG